MEKSINSIRYLQGSTDILIIAPHGPFIDGEFQNDLRTGVIAEEIHKQLGCYTIINDRFFKPKGKIKKNYDKYFLDMFRIDHAGKVPAYLETIQKVVENEGATLVVWLHGIADDFALAQEKEHEALGLFDHHSSSLQALIGYGQGGDPKTGDESDLFTAKDTTVGQLCSDLTLEGMNTIPTHKQGNNYRGRDSKRLNQWFRQLGYSLDQVESIQLEMSEKKFRDTDSNAIKTSLIIAQALHKLIRT